MSSRPWIQEESDAENGENEISLLPDTCHYGFAYQSGYKPTLCFEDNFAKPHREGCPLNYSPSTDLPDDHCRGLYTFFKFKQDQNYSHWCFCWKRQHMPILYSALVRKQFYNPKESFKCSDVQSWALWSKWLIQSLTREVQHGVAQLTVLSSPFNQTVSLNLMQSSPCSIGHAMQLGVQNSTGGMSDHSPKNLLYYKAARKFIFRSMWSYFDCRIKFNSWIPT